MGGERERERERERENTEKEGEASERAQIRERVIQSKGLESLSEKKTSVGGRDQTRKDSGNRERERV